MSLMPAFCKCTCNIVLIRNQQQKHVALQFVRWRKPRRLNLPKAKSKIFRVRERTVVEPEEREKTLEWYRHYNTDMKSIKGFMKQHKAVCAPRVLKAAEQALDEKDWEEMRKLNSAWNADVAATRLRDEIRKEKIAEKKRELALIRDLQERQEMKLEAQQRVKEIMAQSDSFIDETNVDAKIEEMLNTHTEYDFAMFPSGKVHHPESFRGLKADMLPITRSLLDPPSTTDQGDKEQTGSDQPTGRKTD